MLTETKTLLGNTRFAYIWLSQILSQLAINIMNFLLLVRLFELTGSTIATAFLWVSYALPSVVIGPFAAAFVDLYDKRKILIFTNLFQALIILLYALTQETSLFLLYAIVFIYSFLNQFYIPSEFATIPTILSKKHLALANSLFFVTQQSAVILGFGTAGLLSNYFGFANSLVLCSLFLVIAFVSVTFLPSMTISTNSSLRFEASVFKFFERIVEGYKFIKSQSSIIAPFILLISLQIILTIITVNAPLVVRDVFGIPLNFAGLFLVVPASAGAISASILVPKLIKQGWRKKRIIEYSLFLLIVIFMEMAIFLPMLMAANRLVLGIMSTVALGVAFVGVMVPAQTYLQEVTPGGLRGRVFGNFWFMVTVATVMPTIFSGTISEIFGVRVMLAIICLALIGLTYMSKKYGQAYLTNGFKTFKVFGV